MGDQQGWLEHDHAERTVTTCESCNETKRQSGLPFPVRVRPVHGVITLSGMCQRMNHATKPGARAVCPVAGRGEAVLDGPATVADGLCLARST